MMSRAQIVFLHVSIAVVAATGCAFAFMKYAMTSGDPFAVANHPWQPHMLSAHVLVAPLAVFAFGWTFANHIWPAVVNGAPNRGSGIATMLLIAPMVATGYLMQIATEETTRHAFAVVHWICSGAFVVGYLVHLRSTARKRRVERGADAPHS
jgi:hypothetical protein